ncbi:MAG: molecular chaperone [Bacteroidetes bacterium]|nr:molecular chaperone [Bacteroidota bacterium]MBK9544077.1 molecular chaperone [Bacteroidota bacterium]MBP6403458.1 molecular chaperone [Bacteroidia bacterium]
MHKLKQILIATLFLFISGFQPAKAQSVSISPSRLYYKVGMGEYKTQEINVTNNSTVRQSFTVLFSDFEPAGIEGKSRFMDAGESENSCSRWLSATPSFFEIEPGQTQKIQVLLQVPASPDANKVKWAAMRIKLTKEKKAPDSNDKNSIGMGVNETFQFVAHVFQTPPSVTLKSAEIESFKDLAAEGERARLLVMRIRNTGEAILDCASYLEFTNLQTGEEERIKPIAFTILPGGSREIKFTVPKTLSKGKYSVLGVVDFGSRENVQAAELQVEVN